jgi:DNA-binding transcriptional MerR regulator
MAKKLYYKIGEACRALDIQPYVLRYWETEFPVLKPSKSKSGQRVYTEKEITVIRRIKELLYDEGYTIAGAKKRLESEIVGPDETEPTQEKLDDSETESTSALDSATAEKIETLRQGIRNALVEAREILQILESS